MNTAGFTNHPCFEPLTWAAASGNMKEVRKLLAANNIPKDLRRFAAKVAAAGQYKDVAWVLSPPYISRGHNE